ILYVTVPFDSMSPNFIVRSQFPSSFLRMSCSGPGLGGSWACVAGAASRATRATAQNRRAVIIETLHTYGRTDPETPRLQWLHDVSARPALVEAFTFTPARVADFDSQQTKNGLEFESVGRVVSRR